MGFAKARRAAPNSCILPELGFPKNRKITRHIIKALIGITISDRILLQTTGLVGFVVFLGPAGPGTASIPPDDKQKTNRRFYHMKIKSTLMSAAAGAALLAS